MKKLLFALLAALCVQVASAANVVVITYNKNLQILSFDFSGLDSGAYFDAGSNASQAYLTFGSSGGAYTNANLISNTLVDRFSNAVPGASVAQLIRQHVSFSSANPVNALGLGSNTTGGSGADFTISDGTVSYDVSDYFTSSTTDYLSLLPFTTNGLGSFVGTGGFTVIGVTIPEPSSFAALAGAGVLMLAVTRRRRA